MLDLRETLDSCRSSVELQETWKGRKRGGGGNEGN